MMEGTDFEKHIEELISQKVQEYIETVQLATLRKEFLTREEFLAAMDRMDRRFEEVLQNMNQRFEQVSQNMNQRFEQVSQNMNQRFEEHRLEQVRLRASVDNVGGRSGMDLQKAILELMNTIIVQAGVDYKQVERKTLVDVDGAIFFPGFSTDVDVVARDGEVHLFEIKYKADQRDFDHFLKTARLYEMLEGIQPAKLYMITLEISQKTIRATASLPIEVIAGTISYT